MRTSTTTKPRLRVDNFEDLYDESFQSIQWNPGTLRKAMPKEEPKIKKMKSR